MPGKRLSEVIPNYSGYPIRKLPKMLAERGFSHMVVAKTTARVFRLLIEEHDREMGDWTYRNWWVQENMEVDHTLYMFFEREDDAVWARLVT